MPAKFSTTGLAYDDVPIRPRHSDMIPVDVDVRTSLT
jgi:IMP dehydrogenase/GMP reductase